MLFINTMPVPSRYQRSGKPQSYTEAILKFVTLSTIRGMKRVTMSVNWIWSGIWVAAIVTLLGVIVFQLAQHFTSYAKYDVIQTRVEQTDYLINYPSITICPLQPFNSQYAQPMMENDSVYLNGDLHITDYLKKLEDKKASGEITEQLLTLDAEGLASIIGYYQNIKQENVKKFGHAEENLIVDCNIEQTHPITGMKSYTSCANITHIFSAQYFNCYRIVIPKELDASVSNLAMILYLDDFGTLHYPPILSRDFQSQRHGVKVVIHEDETWPDLNGGDEIAPGIAATFHITEREFYLAEPPWGNCSQVLTQENRLPIEKKTLVDQNGNVYKYTQDLCKKFQTQVNVVNKCGCKLALLPIPDYNTNSANDAENITFCDDIDATLDQLKLYMECAQIELKDYRDVDFDDKLDLQCPLPCYDQTYAYIKALSQWPHDSYHLSFYKTFIKNQTYAHKFKLYENILSLSETNNELAYEQLLKADLIERNFVKLSFQMKYKFDVIRQEPKMSQSQLLANIGGTLSLWLGISVIAILELVELLADVFRIYKLRNNGGNTLHVTTDNDKQAENNHVTMAQATSDTTNGDRLQYSNFNGSTAIQNGFPRERYSAFHEDNWF